MQVSFWQSSLHNSKRLVVARMLWNAYPQWEAKPFDLRMHCDDFQTYDMTRVWQNVALYSLAKIQVRL